MERKCISLVTEAYRDLRIDRYLAGRFTYLTRSQWKSEIKDGSIILNGAVITNSHRHVRPGDLVEYQGRAIPEPPVEINYSIIYEDDYLLGVNKPGNLPVHPAGRYFKNTLIMILQDRFKTDLFPLHRLDRETSGVIMFSKNRKVASIIQKNFNRVEKAYIAIVHGVPVKSKFEISLPIGKDRVSKIRKKRAAYPGAPEKALTRFETISVFPSYSMIAANPCTGRLHQIRVHLQYAGCPLVGDKIYGIDESLYLQFIEEGYSKALLQRLEFPRTALHSKSIRFKHPIHDETIHAEAPIPEDMNEFIGRLEALVG